MAVWRKFQDFVYYVLKLPFVVPVPVEWVLYFVAYMFIMNSAHATIATSLSVIGYAHKIRYLPDPTMLCIVRRLLMATRKLAQKPDPRKPITLQLLMRMLSKLPELPLSVFDKLLAQAVLTVMYVAGFRVGEVASATGGTQHTLKCTDVHIVSCAGNVLEYVILLKSYKHSGGQTRTIRVTRKQPVIICPVRSLTQYLQIRRVLTGCLFQHVDGRVVMDSWITQVIRDLIVLLGLEPEHYSSHCLRIGATTDLANVGATDAQIRTFGRWKTKAGSKYIRPAEIVV